MLLTEPVSRQSKPGQGGGEPTEARGDEACHRKAPAVVCGLPSGGSIQPSAQLRALCEASASAGTRGDQGARVRRILCMVWSMHICIRAFLSAVCRAAVCWFGGMVPPGRASAARRPASCCPPSVLAQHNVNVFGMLCGIACSRSPRGGSGWPHAVAGPLGGPCVRGCRRSRRRKRGRKRVCDRHNICVRRRGGERRRCAKRGHRKERQQTGSQHTE